MGSECSTRHLARQTIPLSEGSFRPSARPEPMLGVAMRTLDDVHRLAVREVTRGLSHWFAAMHTDAFVAVLAVAVRTIPCY